MLAVAIQEILDGKHEGQSVTVRGWIYRKRKIPILGLAELSR